MTKAGRLVTLSTQKHLIILAPTVYEIIQANKILEKAKGENVILRLGLKSNINNFKIIGFNDAYFGNLSDRSSQGGYIIYLVSEIGECSPISWQFKKLQRVVKSAMTSETIVKVECSEVCYWIASLLNEIYIMTTRSIHYQQ